MAWKMLSFPQFGSILISIFCTLLISDFPAQLLRVFIFLEIFPKGRGEKSTIHHQPKCLIKIVGIRITLQLDLCLLAFRGLGSVLSSLLL